MSDPPSPFAELLLGISTATFAARDRRADKGINTRVTRGKFQIVRVEFHAAKPATETPLSEWMAQDEIIPALDAL